MSYSVSPIDRAPNMNWLLTQWSVGIRWTLYHRRFSVSNPQSSPLTSGCTRRRVWGIGVVTGFCIGVGILQFSSRFAVQVRRDR